MQGKSRGMRVMDVAVALVCVTSVFMLSLSRLSLCHYHNHSDAAMHTAS